MTGLDGFEQVWSLSGATFMKLKLHEFYGTVVHEAADDRSEHTMHPHILSAGPKMLFLLAPAPLGRMPLTRPLGSPISRNCCRRLIASCMSHASTCAALHATRCATGAGTLGPLPNRGWPCLPGLRGLDPRQRGMSPVPLSSSAARQTCHPHVPRASQRRR